MKILQQKEEYLVETIRNGIALNPLVSIRKMQELVEHNTGRSISDKYVSKLMYKVRKGAVIESDRKKLNIRLTEVRERYRVLMDYLTKVVYWKYDFYTDYGIAEPEQKEKLCAIKLLAQMELALFKAELDAGMFQNRQLAIEEMLKQGVLPNELHEQIIGVFRTWKLGAIKNY